MPSRPPRPERDNRCAPAGPTSRPGRASPVRRRPFQGHCLHREGVGRSRRSSRRRIAARRRPHARRARAAARSAPPRANRPGPGRPPEPRGRERPGPRQERCTRYAGDGRSTPGPLPGTGRPHPAHQPHTPAARPRPPGPHAPAFEGTTLGGWSLDGGRAVPVLLRRDRRSPPPRRVRSHGVLARHHRPWQAPAPRWPDPPRAGRSWPVAAAGRATRVAETVPLHPGRPRRSGPQRAVVLQPASHLVSRGALRERARRAGDTTLPRTDARRRTRPRDPGAQRSEDAGPGRRLAARGPAVIRRRRGRGGGTVPALRCAAGAWRASGRPGPRCASPPRPSGPGRGAAR